MTDGRTCHLRPRHQRGVAALELALTLIPLVLVLAALSSFGMFFLAKQGLARAASEGARALASASLVGPVRAADACAVVDAVMASTNTWVGADARCDVRAAEAGAACGAGALTCLHVRVCYPAHGQGIYPVLGMLHRALGGGGADTLSTRLWAQSTVQFAPPSGSDLSAATRCA